jgi:hypothetical protein
MALDPANYIDELSITDPTASDLVSQGDDQIRTVKRAVKQSFPSVDIAVNAIHTAATAPAVAIAEGLLWIDTSAGAGNHVAKIYDGGSFITLPFSVETAQTVDINGGTIDGTVIGGAAAAAVTTTSLVATTADINAGTVDAVLGGTTPAAITGTTIKANTSLELATGATVTGIDNGGVATGSATLVPTQGAVKTYVDAQVSAHDLDYTDYSDTGGLSVDLDTQTFKITGSTGVTTSGTGQILTVSGTDATTSVKGVASFSSDNFDVSSGAVTIKADGIDDTLIDFGTGANQVSSADVPEATNLYYTNVRADARIAAADIGDLSNVDTTGVADDDILKYDSASSSFKVEPDRIANHLTTKGDLLGFSTTETRIPVGADGKVMTARASATYGIDWEDLVDNSAAMALALGG